MIALAMVYAALVGALLAGAAAAAERALLAGRRATRGAWAAALALTAAATAAPFLHDPPAQAGPDAPAPAGAPGAADPARWAALLARAEARAAEGALVDRVAERLRPADATLAVLWGAATSVLLARRAVARRRLAREARRWPAAVVDTVPVRVAPDAGPAVLGVFRPEIVLPHWLLPDARRALALRHEDAHRRARDPLLLAAADLLVLLAPWNPALWAQRARLRAAVELDCDRRVLRTADPAAYGRLLLDVAGRAAARPTLAPALGGRRTTLERRIRLMTDRRPSRPTRTFVAAAAALAAVAGAAALPRPSVAAAAQAPATQPPAPPHATPADGGFGTRARISVRPVGESASEIAITPVDVAGQPTGPAVRTVPPRAAVGDTAAPLYVIDGRVVPPPPGRTAPDGPPEGMPPADRIERVDVLKGERATRKYGARGRNGVVEITTKAGGAPTTAPAAPPPPLYVIDGRVVPPPPGRDRADGPPEAVPPADRIERVDVLKGEAATRKYGDRGRNGVVEITTKRAPDR